MEPIMDNESQIDINFIQTELIPEMIHNRCFCDSDSREFIELDSMNFQLFPKHSNHSKNSPYYYGNVIINFSGDPKSFPIVVRLLPMTNFDQQEGKKFQNEEIFYSKMILKYPCSNYIVKCYVSDLGRYGMPVLVWEDVQSTQGYCRIEDSQILSLEHLKLCMKLLGQFHGASLKLKCDNFQVFREFYTKLHTTYVMREDESNLAQFHSRTLDILKTHFDEDFKNQVIKKFTSENHFKSMMDILSCTNDVSTICHGNFSNNNLLFKYNEKGVPINLKLIDWGAMRYCSAVVDLGPILFNHLPMGNRLDNVKLLLNVYMDSIKNHITNEHICKELTRDIIMNLHYVYLVLSFDNHHISDEILVQRLSDLNHLGTFDDNPSCLFD